MTDRDRLAIRCGYVAPALAVGAIVLASLVASPETFTWRERALSDMGRAGTRTFVLFNGGLVLAGLAGIPFVRYWLTRGRNRLERVGIAMSGLAVVGMVGVGVFFIEHTVYYLERDLHGVAALTVFGVAPIAQLIVGSAQVLERDRWPALASFWLAVAQLIGWLWWFGYRAGADDPWAWFAVPELIAAVSFAAWIWVLAWTLERRAGYR